MSQDSSHLSQIPDRPHIRPPRFRRRLTHQQLVFAIALGILLLSGVIGGWSAVTHSFAVGSKSPVANMTFQKFLSQGRLDKKYHGPLLRPQKVPTPSSSKLDHPADYTKLPPSTEPATMQPINQVLDSSFMVSNTHPAGSPLSLRGSDQRLEIQLTPGSLDFSHATIAGTTTPPTGAFTLQITQIHGHSMGLLNLLGAYQLQVLDGQKHPVSGIHLLKPALFIYHYQPWEIAALDLDPNHLVMTWPLFLAKTEQAKQPTQAFTLPMKNDARAQTLTASSTVLGPGPFDAGGGDPQNQSPPTPHLASVGGNAGQLSYSYPLQVPPGPAGFAPQLALNYSSSNPNNRYSRTAPANDAGDGWTMSLGSITEEDYPATSASPGPWYFLSGIENVGDRLIPHNPADGFFETEHISRLRIQQVTSSQTGQPCFNIWDKSGTYYQVGCTPDSLQYRVNGTGTKNYRWDVNRIMAPNEGPNTTYKLIKVTYLQDTNAGSIRDSAMEQIVYGYGTSTSTISTVVGTVDFHYRAPTAQGTWADAYNTNYNCSSTPPTSTTLRCDDPLTFGTIQAPTIMSTLSLQSVTSYVGDDSSNSHKAYGYSFSYQDSPFTNNCYDPYTLAQLNCAGEHLLSSITPSVYQNGTSNTLKPAYFTYSSPLQNTYYDSQNTIQGSSTQHYSGQTFWQYMTNYVDTGTNVGGAITYQRAYGNTNGTPAVTDNSGNILDDRHDPLYCTIQANNNDTSKHCDYSGSPYVHPDDRSWTVQVVTQITSLGRDSSASTLAVATTHYQYILIKTGSYTGHSGSCYPYPSPTNYAPGENDCVGDNWLPSNSGSPDKDWLDYYHEEYRGFYGVLTSSPANELTADYYYSTEGWNTANSDSVNYNAGHLTEEDVYSGNSVTDAGLLQQTKNTYTNNPNSCNGTLNVTYNPCEVMILTSRTTQFEGGGSGNSSAPWVQHDYSYDDFNPTLPTSGLISGYHNVTQEVVSSSNAPTLTKKWTYAPSPTSGSWTYYTVNKPKHSEVDDASGHVWQCHDTTYDEGAAQAPSAGWATTVKAYSNCANSSGTITNYAGYDGYGNPVATVDGLATANSSFYTSQGCTLASAPTYFPTSSWGKNHYTTCSSYDSYLASPTTLTNAFGQQGSIGYDYTQGALPTSTTDANNQTTTTSYAYDANSGSNDKRIVSVKQPLESGSYTNQSNTFSSCTTTSTLPCFEVDSVTAQYNTAVTRTFYDSLGRKVETRTPGPSSSYDTIVFTVYNDQTHSTMTSVPFEVTSGSGWVDPNNAVDYQGITPGGTVVAYDALNRPISYQDPMTGSQQEHGYLCAPLDAYYSTACINYSLGSPSGDTQTYSMLISEDPNQHFTNSYIDALGRTRDVETLGSNGYSNAQKQVQYNALNLPTSVTATDLTPQSGESTSSVTTTANYDDLGRLTSVSDPDRGTHTYSYDANGHAINDTSGTRVLGYNYDLLGRVGCINDATTVLSATGACTSGSHPFVQNTYDTTVLGTQGSTDFPIGELTQSVATTYYPAAEGTQASVTQKMQHDQRGRSITESMQLGLPSAWNVTTPLPTEQMSTSYNDANQPVTTTTSSGTGLGYTFTQVYDQTLGSLQGLSNNGSTTTPNLASMSYNARALPDTLSFKTTTGTALASDSFGYDANLRPLTTNASWQSGSGSSGSIFSQTRTYDPASNVLSVSNTQAAVPGQSGSGGSETQLFCYDEQNRLVWAGNNATPPSPGNGTCGSGSTSNSLNGAGYSASYVYTHLGQLWQGPVDGGTTQQQYLYCDSMHPHQLTGVYSSSATCSNKQGQAYKSTYDAWGNVTSRSYSGTTATLSYDSLDHFTEWNAGTSSREWYVYDASGNRVLRRSNNGTTTLTVYAFGLEEHTYNNTGQTVSNNKYYYTLAGRLIGGLIGTTTRFFLTDALGSVAATISNTANSAAVQGNQVYDPYGHQRYKQGSMGTNKGFTGQYNDSLTGLDYYNARYYDQKVGVFLSADVVQGNGQGINPYEYVGGNPETYNDPTGERFISASGQLGPMLLTTSQSTFVNPFVNWTAPWTAPPIDPTLFFPSKDTSQNTGGCPYSGGSAADCFAPHVTTVQPTPIWHTVNLSSGLSLGGVLCSAGIGMPCMSLGGNPGGSITVDSTVNALSSDTLCLNLAACIAGSDSGDAKGEGESGQGEACSFTPATVVTTAHGKEAIGSVHKGEKVLAYNPKTHTMEMQPIVHVWIHADDDLVDLTITTQHASSSSKSVHRTSEVVHTNKKHPFLTREYGFLPVGQITVGMHVLRADGMVGTITRWTLVPGKKTMYNLEVAHDHTFTVGDGQWVVHNCAEPLDVVSYKDNASPFEKHHGILDAWANENIPDYNGADAPTVVLTKEQHNATRSAYQFWRKETTGSFFSKVDWKSISPQEIQHLSETMFDAAGVPYDVRQNYYQALNQYLYGKK